MAGQRGIYGGRSAQDRAAERRARLLEAALTVWAAPERPTTMTAVCAEAGLTERYFYESFANLDDALTTLLDSLAEEIETVTRAAADAAGSDPLARALAVLRSFLQLLEDDPRKGRVTMIESMARPAQRGRRGQLLRHFAHRTAEEVREQYGQSSGRHEADHDEQHDELAGLFFIGGLAEMVTAWLDGSVQATAEELVALAAPTFLTLNNLSGRPGS